MGAQAGPRGSLVLSGRVSQSFWKSQPRRFWRRGVDSWVRSTRPPTPASSSLARGPQHCDCPPLFSRCGIWRSRPSGLGLGPGQPGRRGWCSEDVVAFLYTRNWMEICRGRRQGLTKHRRGGPALGPAAPSRATSLALGPLGQVGRASRDLPASALRPLPLRMPSCSSSPASSSMPGAGVSLPRADPRTPAPWSGLPPTLHPPGSFTKWLGHWRH